MANNKKSQGDPFTVPPASDWNDIVDAGFEFGARRRLGVANWTSAREVSSDKILLKNDSGGQIDRGEVLEIGSFLLATTEWGQSASLWFTGETPAPDGTLGIAVALEDVPDESIGIFQVSGICLAKVAINHAQHYWADVSSSNTTLQTKWHGRAEILQRETGSGTKWALVRLGQMFRGPIKGVCVSTITAGSSGSVRISWGGATSSPSNSVTAWLDWMHNGRNASAGAECLIHWFPDQQKYIITEVEC
jgi:hypothetical protein